jgi:hypothetical protein
LLFACDDKAAGEAGSISWAGCGVHSLGQIRQEEKTPTAKGTKDHEGIRKSEISFVYLATEFISFTKSGQFVRTVKGALLPAP